MPRKLKLRQRGRIVANNSTTNAMSTRTRTPQPPTSSSSTKGAAKAAKSLSDEALFFVDKSAARTAVPTAAAKGKRKRGDDNDVDVNDNDVDVNAAEHKPLRAVHLARERVLGIDAALASNPNAKAVGSAKPNTTPRDVQSSTERLVKRMRKQSNGQDVGERAAQGFASMVAQRRKTDLAASGTYDLWSDSKAPAAVISAISKKKRQGPVARSESAKARALKTVPAVLPPLNAESVNPTMDDYLDFAAATVVSYERDEHDRVKNNQLINATRGRKLAAIDEVLEQELGEGGTPYPKQKPISDDNDDNDDNNDDLSDVIDDDDNDEPSEELSEETKLALAKARALKPPKQYVRESVLDRRHRALNDGDVEAMEAMQQEHFERLDDIAAELVTEKERGAAKTARARATTLARAARSAGIGRNKFSEPDPHVVLPKRIVHNQGRMVRVAATPYSARNLMASLQRRGKAEVGSKAERNYTRTTYNVK